MKLEQTGADFLRSFTAVLRDAGRTDSAVAPFAEALGRIDCDLPQRAAWGGRDHGALKHLDSALSAMPGDSALCAASRAVARQNVWYLIFRGSGIDPDLAGGLLAAQVAGPLGLLPSDELRCGLFLLAPGIHYPLHAHAAGEVYYCLSGSLTLVHGLRGKPFDLRPGSYSVTLPNLIHSLTTGAVPVLLLYVWIGQVDAPNWWWERAPQGGWIKSCWERQPDGAWRRTASIHVYEG